MADLKSWDIRVFIDFLLKKFDCIQSVYLFGSRAYQTKSLRSDIDILLINEEPISFAEIIDLMYEEFPPFDVFSSTDNKTATSAINGSVLKIKDKETLAEQVDAILLWDRENEYSDTFEEWEQKALANIDFPKSIIPSAVSNGAQFDVNAFVNRLKCDGVETYFAGSTWKELAESVVKIIETAFVLPSRYSKKAGSFSFDKIKLNDEYDFQNVIHFLLRPIFPSIEPENLAITIDGGAKKADFGIGKNGIIIEAKHITDASSKASVLKTLEGLGEFYKHNSNVKCLVFLILYNKEVDLDPVRLKSEYDKRGNAIPIFVEFIRNEYK